MLEFMIKANGKNSDRGFGNKLLTPHVIMDYVLSNRR